MLFQSDNSDYNMEITSNLQTIRSFPDPSFPFTLTPLQMSKSSMPYIPWHWHDDLECIWVKSGTITVDTPDEPIILQTGEGVFLNHNVMHTLFTEQEQNSELYSIRFYSSLLFSDASSTLSAKYLHNLLISRPLKHIHLSENNDIEARLLMHMKQTIQIYQKAAPGYELMILSNMYAFWAELNNYLQEHTPEEAALTHSVVTDYDRTHTAMHFIAEHYAEPITLEDIANSMHLSKSECCRCFKRTLSFSPVEFLIQYRIMEACQKMQTKEAEAGSISALSASVGFNSASYFNKQFKRYIKCTPMEYRKRLLAGSTESSFEKDFREIITNPAKNV